MRFIVVPKMHGRVTTYEVIDQDAKQDHQFRLGHHDDERTARAVATVLNDHRAEYTALLTGPGAMEPFA